MRAGLLAALLLPAPALAEGYDCQLLIACVTESATCTRTAPEEALTLHLEMAPGSKTATLSSGGDTLDLTLIDTAVTGRSFLARRGGEAIGLLTLRPDGSLAASSHEMLDGALVGVTGTGHCLPRNG